MKQAEVIRAQEYFRVPEQQRRTEHIGSNDSYQESEKDRYLLMVQMLMF
jgi:hypothetical protein